MKLLLEEMAEQFYSWIKDIVWYNKDDCMFIDKDNNRVYFDLFTDNNLYSIILSPPENDGKEYENKKMEELGYMGCTGISRKPIAGEEYSRGNDLSDGAFCIETWEKIIKDIIRCELVKIETPIKEKYERLNKCIM
jgi:hypothetical protein